MAAEITAGSGQRLPGCRRGGDRAAEPPDGCEIVCSRAFAEEVEVGDQGDLPVVEPDVVVPEVAVHKLTAERDGAALLPPGPPAATYRW